jgi:hypothetical protein
MFCESCDEPHVTVQLEYYLTAIVPQFLKKTARWGLLYRNLSPSISLSILSTGRRLRVFANRVLRRISGLKRDEVRAEKLHNEELHDLYSSPSIIRMIKSRMRWARHVVRMEKKRNAYRLLTGKPEGKRRRWVDNIKILVDPLEMGWDGVDWSELAQDRDKWRALVNAVMNLRVPQNAGKLQSGYTIGGLSSNIQFHRVS